MRILDVSFLIILLATLLRVILNISIDLPGLTDWLIGGEIRYRMIRMGFVFLTWITPVYSLVIGYILWLFGEKKWIIGFSYVYIITAILFRTVWRDALVNTVISQRFILVTVVYLVPILLCSVAWLSTRVRPIAPYFWALGALYLVFNVVTVCCQVLFMTTHHIAWEFVISYVGVFVPIPTLFIIARTKRWIREERDLEDAVEAM
ncbi:hypothetical protein [Dinghuibacter silviterrae]|uniref:Uncharacterized protein n=1 Tax=Dinghuibacter silviterrae TaxID=1539049 RepID=A0A4V3GM37_9BACT|nr:hypothetical protein [Dinghuibacter silviterrae]TDX01893.1 hypothetical protein EDB95_2937 [Dinghuibacter silviterrae]